MQLDAQQAERGPLHELPRQRIAGRRQRIDAQVRGIGRMREAGGRREHAGPGLQIGVEAADHEERQLGEEFAVLVGHVVADHARAHGLHALAPARLYLQRALAGVEGFGDHDSAAAARPTGVRTIGTKPGSASTRASQARTCG